MGRKKNLLRFVLLYRFALSDEVMVHFESIVNKFSSYKKTGMHKADKGQF